MVIKSNLINITPPYYIDLSPCVSVCLRVCVCVCVSVCVCVCVCMCVCDVTDTVLYCYARDRSSDCHIVGSLLMIIYKMAARFDRENSPLEAATGMENTHQLIYT